VQKAKNLYFLFVFMKPAVIIISVSFVLYATFCAIMYLTQRRQIYFPTPESQNQATESFYLAVSGVSIKIWSLHKMHEPAIIYFGGNAEDVAVNLTGFDQLFPDYAIYLVNYRGYGGSNGKPSESALCTDAVAIFDFIAKKHPHISVIGRSLGSGVAAHLASQRPVEKLTLVTPFASLAGVAQAHLPFLPVSFLIKDKYDSAALVPKIKARTLIIIAEDDEIIPRRQSDKLSEQFTGKPYEVTVIAKAGHNTLDNHAHYNKTLEKFFH